MAVRPTNDPDKGKERQQGKDKGTMRQKKLTLHANRAYPPPSKDGIAHTVYVCPAL